MRTSTRIFAFVLLLVSLLTFAVPALAATNYVQWTGTAAPEDYETVYCYVKADKANAKVTVTFGKQYFYPIGVSVLHHKVYGSYEVIVYYKNSAGNWQWESQTTCYNTDDKEIKLKRANCEYRIGIRAKDDSVLWDSYVKNGIIKPCSKCKEARMLGDLKWDTVPKVKVTITKNASNIHK